MMLWRQTLLSPKQEYFIRWNSTFQMLQRYCQLRPFLPFIDNFKAEELLPIDTENDSLDVFMERSSDFDSIAVELQSETGLTAEARILFDAVLQKYPFVEKRLSACVSIIKKSLFEAAVVTVYCGDESELCCAELKLVQVIRMKAVTESEH